MNSLSGGRFLGVKVRISYRYYLRLRAHPNPSTAADRRIEVDGSGTGDSSFPIPALSTMLKPVESKPGPNEITGSRVASAELVEKG
jgi:hypothetical protein